MIHRHNFVFLIVFLLSCKISLQKSYAYCQLIKVLVEDDRHDTHLIGRRNLGNCDEKGGNLHPYLQSQCVPFEYTGCGGNLNNFVSMVDCMDTCGNVGFRR
ncbi:Kunitz/Bovine pancreatic trypsin inhibitor domain protein [Dictyocaulus viviparus]|uniref:Kunitz/Bovine pancreatic trypsin inhibitor domain protein n=1 Tax=Dictyocaulus viviparus TaxID=29172 RepID=A0A0D8XH78_DICVI|nr:Kunitz/Bovine pancreatic trypsin inhibitor domain protein [Dictyocaulus viviparus]